ncbi:hypothetical protein F5887DRAFT_1283597 [Amanita rubescens]|nr:hypothetical protein F5887DRAFT_1283597 [Amanita rubescens]
MEFEKDDPYTFNCLIEGEFIVFLVTVEHDYAVDEFKRVIKGKREEGTLKDVDPPTLELWKPKDSIAATPANTLAQRIGNDLSKIADKLEPTDKLFSIFSRWPPNPNDIHIIVKVPGLATVIQQKRVLSEQEDILYRVKRAKIVTIAPSSAAKPDISETLEPTEKIFDDRPEPDPNIPPVALLYEGFGHFLDIMDGRDVPGMADIDVMKLHREVDDSTLPQQHFLGTSRYQDPPLSAAAIDSGNSDGYNTGPHRAATAVVDIKNRITGINAIPYVELACYVVRLNATGMGNHPELFQQWRVPCLGLTIVGCKLTFYAIITIGHQLKLVSLTPTFSCIQSASDGRDRASLYLAFTAASVLQARILQDVEKLLDNPPSGPVLRYDNCFPAVFKLRKYPPPSNDYFSFKIQLLFPDPRPNRLLYVAQTPDEKIVLIKFARRYSIELHDFCLGLGHAPQILAFERLPGGWYGIAMEWIESGVPITHSESTLSAAHLDRWKKELQDLVEKFHLAGLVHGDLRDANILCKEESMWLIDFDWGGKDGELFYPTANLNPELLDGRVSNDLRITKEDDRRVLRKTLSKLRAISP